MHDVNQCGYEMTVLPDNSGYVMTHNDHQPHVTIRLLKLDNDFNLVSGWIRTPRGTFAMTPADARRYYAEDVATWREIIDDMAPR
ncbi:MAG: hypothetical protein WDO13_08575 [Verrucomicrobiota bacterium]